MKTLLISPNAQGHRLALMAGSQVQDFDFDNNDSDGLLDSIYFGRVLRCFSQFALIDIGLERPGFISSKEKYVEGQSFFVQVVREAMRTDQDKGVQLKPWKENHPLPPSPGLVKQGPTAIERILQAEPQLQIFVEDWAMKAALQSLLGAQQSIDVQPGLFKAYDLEDIWDSLFVPVVPLPPRGNLIIEHTSGFTVIDINSGGDDPRTTNLRAIPVILQHLRWRHLSGNLLIDFIDSHSATMRRTILQAFKQQLSARAESFHILGWSALGPLQVRKVLKRQPLRMR